MAIPVIGAAALAAGRVALSGGGRALISRGAGLTGRGQLADSVLEALFGGDSEGKPALPQISVNVVGGQRTAAMLNNAIASVNELALRETPQIYKILRRQIPVRTGNLRRSARLANQRILINAPYAGYVDRRDGYIDRAYRKYRQQSKGKPVISRRRQRRR